jgi:hypothetical protein
VEARIAYQSKLPRTFRRSLAFLDSSPVPKKTQHAVNGTPARMWSMFDGFTAEGAIARGLVANGLAI